MGESDEPRALKRSGFFSGRLLTPEDFEREQHYVREKLKRHNRTLHGFGIVSGLKVKMNSGQIVVEPGLALDCEGNELLIETLQSIAPPDYASSPAASSATAASSDGPSGVDWHTAYLNVRFVEEFAEPVPNVPTVSSVPMVSTPETVQPADRAVWLTESFELEVARENCNRGHRHLRARWLACGQPHALTIAKLRRRTQGWTVDRGYRAPSIK